MAPRGRPIAPSHSRFDSAVSVRHSEPLAAPSGWLARQPDRRTEHAPPDPGDVDALLLGVAGIGASQREHRDQRAAVSESGARAGLPGLLRAAGRFKLLLPRRHVLGVPGRQLVCERLVRRTVGSDRARDGSTQAIGIRDKSSNSRRCAIRTIATSRGPSKCASARRRSRRPYDRCPIEHHRRTTHRKTGPTSRNRRSALAHPQTPPLLRNTAREHQDEESQHEMPSLQTCAKADEQLSTAAFGVPPVHYGVPRRHFLSEFTATPFEG